MKYIAILSLLLTNLIAYTQADRVAIFGIVKDERTGLKLEDVKIIVLQDGKESSTFVTSLNGKFDIDLGFGHSFDVRFTKTGYVTKFLNIDTRNVPTAEQVGGYGFDLDISLFKTIEGVNFDILKQPIGIAKYSAAKKSVEFDYEYTKSIQDQIAALRKALEKKYKEEEDKLQKEQQLAEAEKLKKEKFEKLVKEGDEQMSTSNYTNAVFKFSEALDLMPATKYVEDKLAAAKKAQADFESKNKLEADYKALLAKADKTFVEKNYKEAIAFYTDALKLKSAEGYPKEKIKEANLLLDNIEKVKRQEKAFAEQVFKGDSTTKLGKPDAALQYYQAAAKLKPEDLVVRQKITDSQNKLDELERVKATDAKYNDFIVKANEAFKAQKYDEALKFFSDASATKPEDAVAKQKITETQAKIAELEKQKTIDTQYAALISKADGALGANDLQTALQDYKQASVLKSTEQYPKTKISEVQTKIDVLAKNEATAKQYNDLISKADLALKEDKLNDASAAYQQASAVKPTEQYPKDKLVEVKAKLDALAKSKANDEQYKQLIAKADQAFLAKQYAGALGTYQQAGALKPEENYPKLKAKEIQGVLNDLAQQKALDEDYKAQLLKGDSLFKLGKYEQSISFYDKALDLKPTEALPKTKIADANTKLDALAKSKALDEQYQTAINTADELLAANKLEQAILSYKKASELKPTEVYPKTKTTEAQTKLASLAKQKALDENYNNILTSADSALAKNAFALAISKYGAASTLKPTEEYPKKQQQLAQKSLDEFNKQKDLEAQFKALITKADGAFTAKKYSDAKQAYQQALDVKPSDAYAKEQLSALIKIEEQQKSEALAKEENFKKAISAGDASFASADYVGAKAAYTEALSIKPTEVYPKQKIGEAEGKLADLAKQADLQKKYQETIDRADAALTTNNLTLAQSSYQTASGLKPNEQYPKDKLVEVKNLLDDAAKKKSAEEAYKNELAKADMAFNVNKFDEAKAAYTRALGFKANEQYPKDKLKEIAEKLAEIAEEKEEKEQQYKDAIAQGDKLFTELDYATAKLSYNEALKLKPSEAYPKQKITEADAKIAEGLKLATQNNKYNEFIDKADKAFKANEFSASITAYQEALTVKPSEAYPTNQINAAKGKLADLAAQSAQKDALNKLIAQGDLAFKANNFDAATKQYEQAKGIDASNEYVVSQLAICKTKLDELAAKKANDDNYKAELAKADAAYTNKKFEEALASYESASNVKPTEAYPKERMVLAKAELAKLAKAEETGKAYQNAINLADVAFQKSEWEPALAEYKKALALKPTEAYPKQKITEAEAKLAEIESLRLAKDAKYKENVSRGDSLFTKKSYQAAINFYTEARKVKPNEAYPKQKITEAEGKLDELAKLESDKKAAELAAKTAKPVVKEPVDPTIVSFKDITSFGEIKKDTSARVVAKPVEEIKPKVAYRTTVGSDVEDFRKQLGENYPEGKTEERFNEGNKDIIRTIFVKNKLGDEYLKVVARFGTFYFKNGGSISTNDFNTEIAAMK